MKAASTSQLKSSKHEESLITNGYARWKTQPLHLGSMKTETAIRKPWKCGCFPHNVVILTKQCSILWVRKGKWIAECYQSQFEALGTLLDEAGQWGAIVVRKGTSINFSGFKLRLILALKIGSKTMWIMYHLVHFKMKFCKWWHMVSFKKPQIETIRTPILP